MQLSSFPAVLSFALVLVTSCATVKPLAVQPGVQPGFRSYIPARIAVLPCTTWPAKYYGRLPPPNVEPKALKSLCSQYDSWVIAGFSDQPYMKGFTPKAVANLLVAANEPKHLGHRFETWSSGGECPDCPDAATYYVKRVASKGLWIPWLGKLSQATRYSDAVLIPIVSEGTEKRIDDRGLLIARRRVLVELLLVDVPSGKLIWTGKRLSVRDKHATHDSEKAPPPFPSWKQTRDQLFVEALWLRFPGRTI